MTYKAPVDDMMFALKSAVGLDGLIADGVVAADEDTIRAVLEEAGKFASEILDPLNAPGDRTGSKLVNGKVVTPPGWTEAYKAFAEGGWASLAAPESLGVGIARGQAQRDGGHGHGQGNQQVFHSDSLRELKGRPAIGPTSLECWTVPQFPPHREKSGQFDTSGHRHGLQGASGP